MRLKNRLWLVVVGTFMAALIGCGFFLIPALTTPSFPTPDAQKFCEALKTKIENIEAAVAKLSPPQKERAVKLSTSAQQTLEKYKIRQTEAAQRGRAAGVVTSSLKVSFEELAVQENSPDRYKMSCKYIVSYKLKAVEKEPPVDSGGVLDIVLTIDPSSMTVKQLIIEDDDYLQEQKSLRKQQKNSGSMPTYETE